MPTKKQKPTVSELKTQKFHHWVFGVIVLATLAIAISGVYFYLNQNPDFYLQFPIHKKSPIKIGSLPENIASNKDFISWFDQRQSHFGKGMSAFVGPVKEAIKTTKNLNTSCKIEAEQDKSVTSPDGKKIACIANGGEPDSDLYVLDTVTHKATTLTHCGTPCSYDNVFWLDNDKFVFLETDTDVEIDHSTAVFDIYYFSVTEYDLGTKTSQSWDSNLRVLRK